MAAPVYVPSSQVEVVGAMNMQGHALTGLPVPSAGTDAARRDMGGATLQNLGAPVNANDAARKAYVDDKVAGFGISDIAIDADKNWNGKNITNAGTISCNIIAPNVVLEAMPEHPEHSKTLFKLQIYSGDNQYATVTSPVKTFNRISGTGQITMVINASRTEADYHTTNTYRLYKNGVVIWSASPSSGESYNIPAVSETLTVDVKTGDQLYIEMVPSRLATTMTATASAAISIPLQDGIIS